MLLLKNGLVYDGIHQEPRNVDILIKEELIVGLGKGFEEDLEGLEVYDLGGKIVIPGGIDPHTHIDHDLGNIRTIDDFTTGSRAAAFGGTTTLIDHIAYGEDMKTSLASLMEKYENLARDISYIDYGFHGSIHNMEEAMESDVRAMREKSIRSMKIYTTYDEALDDLEILKVFSWAKKEDLTICIHCENDAMTVFSQAALVGEGRLQAENFPESRPKLAEVEAVRRMLDLGTLAGRPELYFVHISCRASMELLKEAREEGYENIFVETCPQYLLLNDSVFREADSYKYICSPPLRDRQDQDGLWDYIKSGLVDVIATDHCPFKYEDKKKGLEDFRKSPGGVPGIEERIVLILSEGSKRGLSIGSLVPLLSTNPAKIFDLYPKKGIISPGSYGDLAILEEVNTKIRSSSLSGGSDYSIYEGFDVIYRLDSSILRGKFVVREASLVGNKGYGSYIRS